MAFKIIEGYGDIEVGDLDFEHEMGKLRDDDVPNDEVETVYDENDDSVIDKYEADNFKDYIDTKQFKTFDDYINKSKFNIDKAKGESYDMLKWEPSSEGEGGYGFISLWFNTLTGDLITNYSPFNNSNTNHKMMVFR